LSGLEKEVVFSRMGGAVLDRRRRGELEGTLALGRLAEQMVFSLGRVVRNEPLRPEDRKTLDVARRLFELMLQEDVIVAEAEGDTMLSDESYLDAVHVFEHRGGDLEVRAQQYAELLSKAVAGALSQGERAELTSLRELFIEIGETTLARANELSRPHQEPAWRLMRPATSRS
jgi:hypothetical protein